MDDLESKPAMVRLLLRRPDVTGAVAGLLIALPIFMWQWSIIWDLRGQHRTESVDQSVELIAKIDDGVVCNVYRVHAADGRDLLVTTGSSCRAVEARPAPVGSEDGR